MRAAERLRRLRSVAFSRTPPPYCEFFAIGVERALQCRSPGRSVPSAGGVMAKRKNADRKIRYAVVGMGYISQAAVLPAFQHARRNSELTAIVSDDPEKQEELS